MEKKVFVGIRKSGYTPRVPVIATLIAVFSLSLAAFTSQITEKTQETYSYTEEVHDYREAFTGPEENVLTMKAISKAEAIEAIEAAPEDATIMVAENTVQEEVFLRHFPESTYIKAAIMLTGEAGGVKSTTEQSGCLWIAINRTISSEFPNDIEAVIEQSGQFDGYRPGGRYTEECYELAVDVLERWYREANGEIQVGRTLPVDYLYFTGDGVHNYFRKTQGGKAYIFGTEYASPYFT